MADEILMTTETQTAPDLTAALEGLLRKYAVAVPEGWRLAGGDPATVEDGGTLVLFAGCLRPTAELSGKTVPLLPWRSRRRYVELKRLVEGRTIAPVLMGRFACMTDGRRWPLAAILYRELDLAEWIMASEITSVFASIHGDGAANVIVRLAGGEVLSIEAGTTLPPGAEMQDRHELIARRGVASDRVVDTCVPQSSVYAFTGSGPRQYTDTDFELFGLDAEAVDLVRAAFDALSSTRTREALCRTHRRLTRLVAAAFESDRRVERLDVEGGPA